MHNLRFSCMTLNVADVCDILTNNLNIDVECIDMSQETILHSLSSMYKRDYNLGLFCYPDYCTRLESQEFEDRISTIMEMLVRYGANVDAKDIFGHTAIYHAYRCAPVQRVEKLISLGASVDVPIVLWDPTYILDPKTDMPSTTIPFYEFCVNNKPSDQRCNVIDLDAKLDVIKYDNKVR